MSDGGSGPDLTDPQELWVPSTTWGWPGYGTPEAYGGLSLAGKPQSHIGRRPSVLGTWRPGALVRRVGQ